MKKFPLLLALSLLLGLGNAKATPYVDAARAGAVALAMANTKKAYNAMMASQTLMAGGHVWITEETKKIVDVQTQFYNYINSFHDVLYMAAELYGLYYEVSKTAENIKELGETVSNHPTNILASSFSSKRNKIYMRVAETSLDILMDIKKAVLDDSKMTEFQRFKVFMQVRPKLAKLNKELRRLNLTIKYTSFADLWRDIVGKKTYRAHNLRDIANACLGDWTTNYKKIKENMY